MYVLIRSYIDCKLAPVELLCRILYSTNTSEYCTGLRLVPRATVGRVVITIFFSAMRWLHHPFLCFFWDADFESDIEKFGFGKN